ncbi:MAG: dTDP-4-dehydrorhamnose 3,5-epimerase [candidate division BRC1 bacterium ADurb.BinA364]|nr:MAG: dTDP-4-dehydrorhamnose 3,5-epimerase [candidate division BRC1 bacterium ADurb.BinA364]
MSAIETGINGVAAFELRAFGDDRGWLAEVFRQDAFDHAPAMAYVSVTRPGKARGPHEHLAQSDLFVFAGPGEFEVYLYDGRAASPTRSASWSGRFGESRRAGMIVPPGVIHAYRCVSPVDGWVVNLPNRLYAGVGKSGPVDEIRHENLPASPFYSAFDRAWFAGE